MPIAVMIILLGIVGVGIFIIVNSNKTKREKAIQQKAFYGRAYKMLSSFFLTQQGIIKIYNRLAILSVYNRYEITMMATKYYLMSTSISLGIVIAVALLYKDAIFIIISIMFAVLLKTILIDKQLDKTYLKIYKSLRKAISAIRQEYLRYGSVTEALGAAQYDQILQKPMEEILTVLTSSNGELKLHEFYESTPFRTIQTLAGICYNINNSGDAVDENGHSNFVQALTLMSTDINFEIQRLTMQKVRFGKIEYLPFVPIFAIIPLESFFISIIPGTALMYKAPLGYLCKAATLVSCIITYIIISRINSTGAFKEDDRDIWVMQLLMHKRWNKFINNIVPKGKKARKIERLLKQVVSRVNLKQLYTKKIIYAGVTIILAVIVSFSAISLGRQFIRTSTQQLSLVATSEMDGYKRAAIRALDTKYLESKQVWSEEELKGLIKSYMPALSDLQVLDQVKRLKDKKNSLDNAYFKWWYVWVCFGIGIIGWLIPNISLRLRKYLVETEAEEDFLQLQTLVSILMNTDIDTLDTLQQLCSHSRVHKDMLLYCYHSFPADPEKELVRLQSKTPILEFKRFISKLQLTISDLSLKEAFSDLIIEREHTMRMREMSIMSSLEKRRALCGPLSLLPIGLLVVSELLIPLGVLGFNEFMNALNSFK